LQVAELVGGANFVGRLERDIDTVSTGQLEHEFGLEATLDVKVQLDLGQCANEAFHKR